MRPDWGSRRPSRPALGRVYRCSGSAHIGPQLLFRPTVFRKATNAIRLVLNQAQTKGLQGRDLLLRLWLAAWRPTFQFWVLQAAGSRQAFCCVVQATWGREALLVGPPIRRQHACLLACSACHFHPLASNLRDSSSPNAPRSACRWDYTPFCLPAPGNLCAVAVPTGLDPDAHGCSRALDAPGSTRYPFRDAGAYGTLPQSTV